MITNNNRIDAPVVATSMYKRAMLLAWLVVMLIMMVFANLLWWKWLVVMVVTASSLFFYRLQKISVVHITQPATHNYDKKGGLWYVYVDKDYLVDSSDDNCKYQHPKQLWQASVSSVYVSKYVVILYFSVLSPCVRTLAVALWRDQLAHDDWRKLQVFCRLF